MVSSELWCYWRYKGLLKFLCNNIGQCIPVFDETEGLEREGLDGGGIGEGRFEETNPCLKGPKNDQVGYEFFLHKADPYG